MVLQDMYLIELDFIDLFDPIIQFFPSRYITQNFSRPGEPGKICAFRYEYFTKRLEFGVPSLYPCCELNKAVIVSLRLKYEQHKKTFNGDIPRS